MSRRLLFALLLSSAVALAADKQKTQPSDGAPANQKKAAAARPTEETHATAESSQQGTREPQAKTNEAAQEAEKTQAKADEGAKLTSVPDAKALGMSILGNQDAPKSLVIVPWKSSELGDSPGISPILDDSRQPVDKDVFMRSLRYYEIRSKTKQ